MALPLTISDLTDLARGAAFLATGGGGNPYIGRLMVEQAMRETGRELTLLDVDDLADDDFVIPTAMMGAPTVIVEKLPEGYEAVHSLQVLEQRLGRKATATMPIEAGGVNSMIPLVVAVRENLPIVDGDGMGRAFPELFHETFHIYGVAATPMAVSDEYHDHAVIETHDNFEAEWFARGLTIRMGGVSFIAEYAMDGATAKRTAIRGTIRLGLQIGRTIREARTAHANPFDALSAMFATTSYTHAKTIFTGKITEVFRRIEGGFSKGTVKLIELVDDPVRTPRTMEIEIQNENLIAIAGGQVLAMVPDLICILDSESAEPITTEELRYGQRVTVMAVSVPEIMRTPEALAVWGPRHFGYDIDYVRIEEL
jgi:DUF917 family protein